MRVLFKKRLIWCFHVFSVFLVFSVFFSCSGVFFFLVLLFLDVSGVFLGGGTFRDKGPKMHPHGQHLLRLLEGIEEPGEASW